MAEAKFPSNSKKIEIAAATPDLTRPFAGPVVPEGSAIERKKPLGKRIAESFSGDSAKSTGEYVLFDVIIPNAKELLLSVGWEALQRMIMGSSYTNGGGLSGGLGRNIAQTAYNRMSSIAVQGRPGGIVMSSETPKTRVIPADERVDINNLYLRDRGKAELVLAEMRSLISTYGFARVPDLLGMLSISGSWTDENFGWSDLSAARVRPTSRGFLLLLPPVESLN